MNAPPGFGPKYKPIDWRVLGFCVVLILAIGVLALFPKGSLLTIILALVTWIALMYQGKKKPTSADTENTR